MRKQFTVKEDGCDWDGKGVEFCDLRRYFDIPEEVRKVVLVLSDEPHEQAYTLRLCWKDDYVRLEAYGSIDKEIYILHRTRRTWTPYIERGMIYLTLEC